ncbi:lipase family protein [Rhodococcus gannanensis]|uniref:Lipase family protein n=1 Tax=Rhodococcus gannanensis TaxID=1960308 RepID=A0ABW4NYB7_9NOCA
MRLRLRVLSVLLTVCGALVSVPAAASAELPGIDDFYRAPAGFESAKPGTILGERPVRLASYSELPFNAQAWQLLYRTTDFTGAPTTTVTTVILPAGAPPTGGRPLLSYQVAHDSSDPACGPSVAMRAGSGPEGVFTQSEMTFVDHALQQGWAVSVPDHEGPSARIAAPREPGYAVLDGIRAAQAFAPLGLAGTRTPVGLWGYSGGGLATGWAAQVQPTYAPELDLRGVAMGSPAPDPAAVTQLGGTAWSGLAVAVLASLRQVYPDVGRVMDAHLTPGGRAAVDAMSGQCVARAVASNAFRPTSDFLTVSYAQLVADPAVAAALADAGLGGSAPTAPVYVYSGVHDEIIPISTVDTMVDRYCRGGTPVTYRRDETSLHATLIVTGASDALNWLRARFDGAPVPSGCDTRTVTSTVMEPGAANTYVSTNSGVLGTMLGVPIGPR